MLKKIMGAAVAVALMLGAWGGAAFAAVPKAQESRFAALRHAPTSSVPAEVKQFAKTSNYRDLQLALTETRRLQAPGGGSWDVIPGVGGICLYVESEQTGTCASTQDAVAGRLNLEFVEPGAEVAPRPGEPYVVPTNTPRKQVGLLPDEAVTLKAVTPRESLSTQPNADGLYQLSSRHGLIGTVTMLRAGKSPLKIGAARERFNGPSTVRAHKATCTPGNFSCYCQSIPEGYGNSCWYGTSYNYAFYSGQWGMWKAVRSVKVFSADTNTICGNAYNPDNTWAGNFFCNSGYYYAVHNYIGTMRIAWAGPGGASASVLGKAYYEFDA